MFLVYVYLATTAVMLAAAWAWYNRPLRILARLESRYNLIVPQHRRGDAAERLALLSLRMSTRLIEVAGAANALAGRVLNRPANLQSRIDELGRSTAVLAATDKLMELILTNLHDNAEKAKKGDECMKLEARVYELLSDFHRYQRLRDQLVPSARPAQATA